MAKGYFNINGTAYYGYDLIYLSARYNNISPYAFIRYDALTSYYNQDDIFCDSTVKDAVMKSAATIKPPQGSKLYLCKPNPYANADVRKCYSITYDVDSADYIVKNPDKTIYRQFSMRTLIMPKLKRIAIVDGICRGNFTEDQIKEYAIESLTDIYSREDIEENLVYTIKTVYGIEDEAMILSELGLGKKYAYAFYENIDMSSGDDVTLDSLKIVWQAVVPSSNEQQAVLALQTFNNLNWRNFPGTIWQFIAAIRRQRYNCSFNRMSAHPSRFSKPVREFLEIKGDREFANAKDYYLWQEFMKDYFGLKETKFVNLVNVNDKIRENMMTDDDLSLVFSCITRIKPKTYEDYLSEKQKSDSAD